MSIEIDSITDDTFEKLAKLSTFLDKLSFDMDVKGLDFTTARITLEDIHFFTEHRNGEYGAIEIHMHIILKDYE